MQIVGVTYIGNIYEEMAKQAASAVQVPEIVDLSKAENRHKLVMNNISTPPPTPDGPFRPLPPLIDPAVARENSIRHATQMQEAFYTGDETLNYTPGDYSIDIEIALATQQGYAGIVDGKLTPSFSGGVIAGSAGSLGEQMNIQLAQQRSPLNALKKLDNLKSLYEHLGDDAVNHTAEFDTALQGIIDEFTQNGGVYVGADKQGIADSFRAIMRGEEGKYTAEDMKTMAVLAFEAEAVSDKFSDGRSEHTLGARLGYDALSIEMAYKAGKLSSNAYESVKATFDAIVDEMIKKLDEYTAHASKDPYRNKDLSYSSVRPEAVRQSIDVMLRALDSADFTQGLRSALKTLEDMHNAQRDNQLDNGKLDQRYNIPFFGGPRDQTPFNDRIQVNSKFFTEYLGKPEWAIKGNLFSVSMFA